MVIHHRGFLSTIPNKTRLLQRPRDVHLVAELRKPIGMVECVQSPFCRRVCSGLFGGRVCAGPFDGRMCEGSFGDHVCVKAQLVAMCVQAHLVAQ